MALDCLVDFLNIGEKHKPAFTPFLGVPVFIDALDKSKHLNSLITISTGAQISYKTWTTGALEAHFVWILS